MLSFRFSRILLAISLALFAFIPGAYLVFGGHPYMDAVSIMLLELILLALMFFTLLPAPDTAALRLFFVAHLLLWHVSRVFILIFMPWAVRFDGDPLFYTAEVMNKTLLFVLLGVVIGGLALCVHWPRNAARQRARWAPPQFPRISSVLLYGLVTLAPTYYLYLYYYEGFTRYGSVSNVFSAVLNMCLNHDIHAVIGIGYTLARWRAFQLWEKALAGFWILLFVSMLTLVGSKGGFYTILLSTLLYKLAVEGDFLVRVRIRQLAVAVVLAPILIQLYTFGDSIRYAGYWGVTTNLEETISASKDFQNFNSWEEGLLSISGRMSQYEYFAVIVNHTDEYTRQIVNLPNNLKIVANFLLPGSPFPNQVYSLELFKVCYRGFSLDSVLDGRYSHGDHWPMFGMAYVLFGPWGAWPALFVMLAALGLAIQYLQGHQARFGTIGLLVGMFAANTFINDAFGLDHFIQKTIIYSLSYFFFMFLLRIIGAVGTVTSGSSGSLHSSVRR